MKTIKLLATSAIAATMLCACGSGDGEYDASGIFETTEVIVSASSLPC